MTQANESETDEPTLPFALRREPGVALGTEQRSSRVLLRIPDCTSRLPSIGRESPGWWSKLQAVGELGGPWLDLVRPVLPPRVLAAAAIGILLGVALILLTPGNKHSPTIHTHSDQAATVQAATAQPATGQRAVVPKQIEEPNGPRANIGTTGRESKSAAEANSPATIEAGTPPRYENAQRPADARPAPAKRYAELEGRLN